ncbi:MULTISPECIES: N-acetylglucosamine-6-phosphate deacetylase [Chitinophagaceae]
MSSTIYTAGKIFTGEEILQHHAVEISNGRIIDVQPISNYNNETIVTLGEDALLAPAFLDIQLYGAHGRLLSVFPDRETVEAIYQYSKNGGAAYSMPTVATNSYPVFFQCIDAVRNYWEAGGKGILGLQIEGPWISKAKKGAHLEKYIFSPDIEQVKALLDYGKGIIKMITLAPEVVSPEIINYIQEQGIIVSAGHSDAAYETATKVITDCQIPTATHLYNAMSPLSHRAPGIVGAIFNHSKVMSSIIPDGYHVDFPAIQIAKKIMRERLFAITDAVTDTTTGDYKHTLDGDKYVANGTLSGSALTMVKCLQNLVRHADIELEEALRMCSLYPAQAINKDTTLGKIATGQEAIFVVLDEALNVLQVLD